jgi:hypothetical protein
MNPALERYLNDHLAGSAGAVDLIEILADRCEDETERAFFSDLKEQVEQDRGVLEGLLEKSGSSGSGFLEAAGELTAKAARLKLRWEGLHPGSLGMLEAIEMLALGIEGKLRLWRLLSAVSGSAPEWQGIDFAALEESARAQGQAVEERRIRAGREALIDPVSAAEDPD